MTKVELLKEFAKGCEQEHFNCVRRHLNLIEEIGYENYLIEQLG